MPESVEGVMREFKRGALHSGSSDGRIVTKRSQAIAIALNQRRGGKRRESMRHAKAYRRG